MKSVIINTLTFITIVFIVAVISAFVFLFFLTPLWNLYKQSTVPLAVSTDHILNQTANQYNISLNTTSTSTVLQTSDSMQYLIQSIPYIVVAIGIATVIALTYMTQVEKS